MKNYQEMELDALTKKYSKESNMADAIEQFATTTDTDVIIKHMKEPEEHEKDLYRKNF